MHVGTSNIFQNASFINQKKTFAGAHLNNAELSKTDKSKEGNKIQGKEKPKNPLERLMEQRQRVTEQKYSLIGKTLEKGGDVKSIEVQIEAYDEQIKAIDLQIASIMAEEMKKQEKNQDEGKNKEAKTEEEIQISKTLSLISNSNNVEQAEVVQSVKGKLKGEAKILASEIALDNTSPGGALGSKIERLAKVEGEIVALETDVANRLANVNTDIIEDKENIVEINEKEDSQEEEKLEENNPEYPQIDVYA